MALVTPQSPDDYAANVRAARVEAAKSLGLAGVREGTPAEYAALSQADQVRLTDEMSAFIVANQAYFSPTQVEIAQRRVNSPGFRTPLADTSIGAADFVRAYGETVGEFVEGTAGVAGRSLEKLGVNLGVVIAVVGIGALVWFTAPHVLPKIKAALGK